MGLIPGLGTKIPRAVCLEQPERIAGFVIYPE